MALITVVGLMARVLIALLLAPHMDYMLVMIIIGV